MKSVKGLKIIVLVFPGLTLAILLLFTFGETIGGDWSGFGHLVQVIPIAFLMGLGWKHPLSAGILFIVLVFLAAYSLSEMLRGPGWLAPMLIMIVPLFLSGILLLSAAGFERKAV